MIRIASDLAKAHAAIAFLDLRGPADMPGQFTFPKDVFGRQELADLIFEVAGRHAARAVLDAPIKHSITFNRPKAHMSN